MAERVDLIRLKDLTAAEIEAWRELAGTALEPNPFFEPEYLLPLGRAFDLKGEVALAVLRDGELDWKVAMPVREAQSWHKIPGTINASWHIDTIYTLLGTPLVTSDRSDSTVANFMLGLARQPRPPFVGLDMIGATGRVYEEVAAIGRKGEGDCVSLGKWQRAFVHRRDVDDYVATAFSKRRRKELRRRMRRLSEQVDGEIELVSVDGDPSAMEELIRMEGESRYAAEGSVLAANSAHVEFFREMTRAFAEAGRLRALALKGGGETVAVICDIRAGDGIFGYKTAYDNRFSDHSPGTQLECKAMSQFHEEESAQWMDSCAGANNSAMNELWTDRRSLTSLMVRPGRRGWIRMPMVSALAMARKRHLSLD